ncbi:MAG: zinc ribbon domain-containing protein [Candidatus Dojkabacteria bacterium]|nr:zinc ribbon domain-containing protein [Candidatus Dojkabacteria bacterium]
MIKCPACGKDIASSADTCPFCGAKQKKPIYNKWWFWVLLPIVILFSIVLFITLSKIIYFAVKY